MKRRTALVVFAGMVGLAGPAAADETTFCNAFITSLPYTIVTQGHYCFNRNLSTAITTGNAVTINVDYVVLDLNNFKLGGGSAGLSTTAVGVYASNRRNITVRNGNIRGFKYGIRLIGSNSGNLLVENNVLDGNTYQGVETDGDSALIRNNFVTNTGGTTSPTATYWAYGIYADYSGVNGSSQARDNVVLNTFASAETQYGIGGIGVAYADHNTVSNGDPLTGNSNGIWANVCRDNTVFDATTPYSCTGVGDNHPPIP